MLYLLFSAFVFFFFACRLLRIEERVNYWTFQYADRLDRAHIKMIQMESREYYARVIYFSPEWANMKQQNRILAERLDALEKGVGK